MDKGGRSWRRGFLLYAIISISVLGAGCGSSDKSQSSSVPVAPSDLQAAVVSSSRIDLSWADNSSDEEGFKIERKTGSGGTYAEASTAAANVTAYSDPGLSAGTTYYYRLYAYNSAGNSSYSEAVSATTSSASPSGQTVSITSGCFDMGDAFGEGDADELPVHNVCIPSVFGMDIYEVTNAKYEACVSAGSCTAPAPTTTTTQSAYYGDSTYDSYPIVYVSWDQASAYCAWAGGRLPTEAEWEHAARGGLSGKKYPWGDDDPICTSGATNGAQYSSCSPQDLVPVGSFAANNYGLYDMAGNVWEWVEDWYSDTYYSSLSSPASYPEGPTSGTKRVLRGGSWSGSALDLRVSSRYRDSQSAHHGKIGFRCAQD